MASWYLANWWINWLYFDFRNEIPFNKENFCTGVHLTDKGSEIIAKKIADILVNDLN